MVLSSFSIGCIQWSPLILYSKIASVLTFSARQQEAIIFQDISFIWIGKHLGNHTCKFIIWKPQFLLLRGKMKNEMNKGCEATSSGPNKEVKHGWFESSISCVRTVSSGVSFIPNHSRKLYILHLFTVGSHIHRFLMDLQSNLFTGQSFVNLYSTVCTA